MIGARTKPLVELLLGLGGPLIWVAHFTALYGGATLSCLEPRSTGGAFHTFALASTVLCIMTVGALVIWQGARVGDRNGDGTRFLRAISMLLGAAAILAIAWGAMPVLFLSSCSPAAG
jgi:hypothetical protein